MKVSVQIEEFKKFYKKYYPAALVEALRKGDNFFVIDFHKILLFNPKLADLLLEEPNDVIKAAEIAIEQFDVPKKIKNFKIRISNLPKSQKVMIREIRSKHIGKFLLVEGTVRIKTDVRPQVTSAKFECPSCGNIITVIQNDKKFKEPSRCGCGRKGKFKLLSSELIDAQGITLEETASDLEGGEQPKRIKLFLKGDLVSPISDKKTNPGAVIRAIGVITEIPIYSRSDGGKLTRFDYMFEVNYFEPIQEDYSSMVISKEEEKAIKEIAQDPNIFQKLVTSIAPGIYGHEKVKEALLLQFAGGVRKIRNDGVITRGDIHILLVGDPGAGKSQLLKRSAVVAPKARYVTGKGVSGAGLTASVVKDDLLGGWSLEAGALVLSNMGVCMIDELDKMDKNDRSAMHEALEQQTVSISKANIQATLRAETTVLAAANPRLGRFDPYEVVGNQIDLPPALINRFDLIFTIRDLPDMKHDEELASFILDLHKKQDTNVAEIDTNLLRKYLSYARMRIQPKITEGAIDELKKYFLKMRGSKEKGELKAIPISARQLEALIRLTEASSKLRLSDKATKKDARKAVEILHYCLSEIGMDPETGKIDIDRITTGISASQRSKIVHIRDIINELENVLGRTIPVSDIVKEATNKGLKEEEVEEAIEKLRRSGDIFEPKRGFISKL